MTTDRKAVNPEQATIRGFVARPRQGLYLAMLSDSGNRKRLTERLLSGRDIDPANVVPIPEDEQAAEMIESRLRRSGAADQAHVISADPDLDGHEQPLADAIRAVVGANQPSLVSCVAGRLAYYHGPDGERLMLQTAGSRKSGRS